MALSGMPGAGTSTRTSILVIATLIASGSLPSPCRAGLPSRALIVVVRADGVERSELGGDPERTPRLRELCRRGTSLPSLGIPEGSARGSGDLVDGLLPASLLRELEKRRLEFVRLKVRRSTAGEEAVVIRAGEEGGAGASAGKAATARAPSAMEELRRRFGDPGPPSQAESDFYSSIQSALAVPFEGAPPSTQTPRPPRPIPSQLRRVLEKGAALVVVEDTGGEPSGRDELIGEIHSVVSSLRAPAAADAAEGSGAGDGRGSGLSLAVLSYCARDGSASLIAEGPALRPGWVLSSRAPFAALGPTLLYILDPKLVSATMEPEVLHDLLR